MVVPRYDRGITIQMIDDPDCMVPAMTLQYSLENVPSGWEACTHPEGALYFYHQERNTTLRVVIGTLSTHVWLQTTEFLGVVRQHLDMFPHNHKISEDTFTLLMGLLLHANIDRMTSLTSTVAHNAEDLHRMLGLVKIAKSIGNSEYATCIVGRLMYTFAHERFLNFAGLPHARLSRDQNVFHERRHRTPLIRVLSLLFFNAPKVTFLTNRRHPTLGLETLAIIYSLPYALLMWAMITFLLAFAFECFFDTDDVAPST
ncbi:hypothetical protein A0H81_12486 [Grifola frondosa]|uniref:Uncharacterized protein n=1 Tax=Grifola frondosa TaxID=5627 RepID=A0A1C7LYQ3_GRIFR|nr:hypothetical protein A0H81_12486 [Grifola frondosa]